MAAKLYFRINEQRTSYVIMGDTQGDERLYLTVQIRDEQEYSFERLKLNKIEKKIKILKKKQQKEVRCTEC